MHWRSGSVAGPLLLLCAGLTLFLAPSSRAATEPQRVILDTDMGNDVDDALALAMLHAFESRGDAKLLAVTVSKGNPWAAEYIRLVNEYYGRPSIPVGLVRNGKTSDDGKYVRAVCEKHGRKPGASIPDAVELLRTTLEREADHAVTIYQIGFSTNLAALLEAPGGSDLVKRKVRKLFLMAGDFVGGGPEYNVKTDIPAARKLFADWPTEMVFSGFEIGLAIHFPAVSIEHDFAGANPVTEAYRLYQKMPYDRPTWDLTAVLAGLRSERGYFAVSVPGTVTVGDDGSTAYKPDPAGKRTILRLADEEAPRVREALIWLGSQPAAGTK